MNCDFIMSHVHYRHRNRHIVNNRYRGIEDELSSQGSNPQPPKARDLVLHLANDISGLVFWLFQRPGKVAELLNVCTGT